MVHGVKGIILKIGVSFWKTILEPGNETIHFGVIPILSSKLSILVNYVRISAKSYRKWKIILKVGILLVIV